MITRTAPRMNGDVTLTFTLPENEPSGHVSVVGDFNDWQPGTTELQLDEAGHRSATITVPAGAALHFRYLGENGNWFDDADADVKDQHGGVITV